MSAGSLAPPLDPPMKCAKFSETGRRQRFNSGHCSVALWDGSGGGSAAAAVGTVLLAGQRLPCPSPPAVVGRVARLRETVVPSFVRLSRLSRGGSVAVGRATRACFCPQASDSARHCSRAGVGRSDGFPRLRLPDVPAPVDAFPTRRRQRSGRRIRGE